MAKEKLRSKGKPTAKARKKYGDKNDKYPIFDVKSALNAIKLRHNGKGVSSKSVLNRVSRSKFSKNPKVKEALKKAKEVDKNK